MKSKVIPFCNLCPFDGQKLCPSTFSVSQKIENFWKKYCRKFCGLNLSSLTMETSLDAVFNTFIDTNFDPPPQSKTKKREPHTKSKQKFTPEEDQIIIEQVNKNGQKCWRHIAEHLPGRTARQCRERWVNYLSPNVSRDPWNKHEDDLLVRLVSEYGQQWSRISSNFPLRTDVMLKNRWSYLKRRVQPQAENTSSVSVQQEVLLPTPAVSESGQISLDIAQAANVWADNEEYADNLPFCDFAYYEI